MTELETCRPLGEDPGFAAALALGDACRVRYCVRRVKQEGRLHRDGLCMMLLGIAELVLCSQDEALPLHEA